MMTECLVQVDTVVGPMVVDTRDRSVGRQLRESGCYEAVWTRWLETVIQPGMRVMDVGGNIGYYTVLFGKRVEHGSVLVFEPDPHNRSLLERNVILNGLSDRVTIVQAAVADTAGVRRFHADAEFLGVHSLAADNRVREGGSSYDVPTVTLDDAVRTSGIGAVDFIKIDAQGAEAMILRGATSALAQERLMLMMELWPGGLANCGSSLADVLGPLRDAGFAPYQLSKKRLNLKGVTWEHLIEIGAGVGSKWSSFNAVFAKPAQQVTA